MTTFILLTLLSFSPQDAAKWQTLAPKESGFAVELPPGDRQQSDTPFGGPGGPGTLHQVLIGTDDIYCDLKGYEHQKPIARAEERRLLDWARDKEVGPGSHGKLIAEKDVKLGSSVGREFTLNEEFGHVEARGRAFVKGSTVYVLVAWSRRGGRPLSSDADRFLGSFTFGSKPAVVARAQQAPGAAHAPAPLGEQGPASDLMAGGGPPAGAPTPVNSLAPVLKLLLGPVRASLLMGVARLGMSRTMGNRPPGMVAEANPPASPPNVPAAAPSIPAPETARSVRPTPKRGASKSWGEEVDPDGDVQVVRRPSSLIMTIPGSAHVLAPERGIMNAPRVVRPIEGDFMASVLVAGAFRPARGSTVKGLSSRQAGGLIVWKDAENYLVFQHRATADDGDSKDGVVLEEIAAGRKGVTQRLPVGDGPLNLRLEHKKRRLVAAFSDDGKNWKELKPVDAGWATGKVQVGVVAVSTSSGPHEVMFDDLMIEKP